MDVSKREGAIPNLDSLAGAAGAGQGRAGQGRQVKAGSPPVSAVCASSLPHALIGLFINHALCTL